MTAPRRPWIVLFFVLASVTSAPGGPNVPDATIEIFHVQNAGVLIRGGGHSVLVDALTDLTSEPGTPPRPFDRLATPQLQALRHGRSSVGCVDLVLVTHRHPDHFTDAVVRDYLDACPDAALFAPDVPESTERQIVASIPVTTLALEHVPLGNGPSQTPHVGHVVHLGAWDVFHCGDAAGSRLNVDRIRRVTTSRRALFLVPYWFLEAEVSRTWMETLADSTPVVLLHVDPWRRPRVQRLVDDLVSSIPGLVLPEEHADVPGRRHAWTSTE